MKNSLEDLLKQVYEQKEVPSQELYQNILQKMKEKERESFFWKKDLVYHKGVLVAVCTGMIIIIGLGMMHWQGGLGNRNASFRQDIAEHVSPVPVVTDDPVGVKNRVETENETDTEKQTEAETATDLKIKVETENKKDLKNRVETKNKKDLENETGKDQKSSTGQTSRKDTDPPFSRKTDTDLRMPGRYPAVKPGVQNTGGVGMDANTDSGNLKPSIQATAAPKESFKPSLPSGAEMPQNTPRPQDNYISLCSIETYIFSGSSQTDDPDGSMSVPDSVFTDRLIFSYEKLQTLIQELENYLSWKEDDSAQKFIMQLWGNDRNYFNSNALCVSIISLHAGTDLKLSAVNVRDMGQGDYCLDIWLDKIVDETEQSSDMLQYSSLISVPKEIAGQCSMVQFHYSDG